MGADPTRVADLAQTIIDVIVAKYAAEGIDLPGRRYRLNGQAAWDCEQLVVGLARLFTGSPGHESAEPLRINPRRGTEMQALLVRCAPVIKSPSRGTAIPPSAAELDASGEQQMIDSAVMTDAIAEGWFDGTIRGKCDDLLILRTEPVGPEGGYVGTLVTFQAQV